MLVEGWIPGSSPGMTGKKNVRQWRKEKAPSFWVQRRIQLINKAILFELDPLLRSGWRRKRKEDDNKNGLRMTGKRKGSNKLPFLLLSLTYFKITSKISSINLMMIIIFIIISFLSLIWKELKPGLFHIISIKLDNNMKISYPKTIEGN